MKKEYLTQPRRRLLEFLQSDTERQYTIDEIAAALASSGGPGRSTVYRQMNRLVEEGAVRRFVKGNSRQFLYQMVKDESCASHLHLKCTACGRLVHLDEETTEEMEARLSGLGFEIDEGKTLLYGRCAGCKKKDTEDI